MESRKKSTKLSDAAKVERVQFVVDSLKGHLSTLTTIMQKREKGQSVVFYALGDIEAAIDSLEGWIELHGSRPQ